MRKERTPVAEFVNSLYDEDLKFVGLRFIEKYSGDIPDALNFMSQFPEIDQYLSKADSAFELFDLCDHIKDVVLKEAKKRGMSLIR